MEVRREANKNEFKIVKHTNRCLNIVDKKMSRLCFAYKKMTNSGYDRQDINFILQKLRGLLEINV